MERRKAPCMLVKATEPMSGEGWRQQTADVASYRHRAALAPRSSGSMFPPWRDPGVFVCLFVCLFVTKGVHTKAKFENKALRHYAASHVGT